MDQLGFCFLVKKKEMLTLFKVWGNRGLHQLRQKTLHSKEMNRDLWECLDKQFDPRYYYNKWVKTKRYFYVISVIFIS